MPAVYLGPMDLMVKCVFAAAVMLTPINTVLLQLLLQ
jgi:hypothetical protein